MVVLSFLIGNNDAHGKNYSLLYLPASPQATLAPAYDLLSTVVYPGLSRKMAMSIGGEYRPDYVQPRHLNRLLEQAGLGPAAARRRIRALAESAPSAVHQAYASLAEEGWDAPVLERIVETVEKRASKMLEIAAAAPRVRAG
jgi:serine/threonine-protein kinase HipA